MQGSSQAELGVEETHGLAGMRPLVLVLSLVYSIFKPEGINPRTSLRVKYSTKTLTYRAYLEYTRGHSRRKFLMAKKELFQRTSIPQKIRGRNDQKRHNNNKTKKYKPCREHSFLAITNLLIQKQLQHSWKAAVPKKQLAKLSHDEVTYLCCKAGMKVMVQPNISTRTIRSIARYNPLRIKPIEFKITNIQKRSLFEKTKSDLQSSVDPRSRQKSVRFLISSLFDQFAF